MVELSRESLLNILAAPDYRAFISIWMLERGSKKLSYAGIARNAGFRARSFPRDVIAGSKRLTYASLPKMAKGLRLPADLAAYFKTLVELEHPDCRGGNSSEDDLIRVKVRQQERILARRQYLKSDGDNAFRVSHVPEVYAALGVPRVGATLEEIARRTQLSSEVIEAALDHMMASGIVKKVGRRYQVFQLHLNLENLKQSEVFKKHFISNAERAARQMKAGQSSDEKLFFSSAFSVRRSDLPQLKDEFRDLILKFIDRAETSDGDKVVNLIASLF